MGGLWPAGPINHILFKVNQISSSEAATTVRSVAAGPVLAWSVYSILLTRVNTHQQLITAG